MAGIEKLCEYSGEYPGWHMYLHKRNHIQIMPKYRKLFRYQPHVLFWFKPKLRWINKMGGVSDFNVEELSWFDTPYKSISEYENDFGLRRQLEYWYMLYVPGLPGIVNGQYVNYTVSRTSTRRRLKRMLRCKRLNEINLDCFLSEFDISDHVND